MKEYKLTIVVKTDDDFDENFVLFDDDVIDGFQLSRDGEDITGEFHLKEAYIEKVEHANVAERRGKIQEIKRILEVWGPTDSSELELDSSPCLATIGNGKRNVSELVEFFNEDGVGTVMYHDQIEIGENSYTYDELSDELIDEISEIMENYDADMLQTMDRCRD